MEANYEEFRAAFWIQVRSEDGVDAREARLREVLRLKTNDALLMEPSDLAAMMSCCVMANSRFATWTHHLQDAPLEWIIAVLNERERLPLIAKSGHPVNRLLEEMLLSDSGRECYHAIASCLSQARSDREVRPHLYLEKEQDAALPTFADLERMLAEGSAEVRSADEEDGDAVNDEDESEEACDD